jgi:hypothetical protein
VKHGLVAGLAEKPRNVTLVVMDRQLTIGMALECVDDMKGQLFPVEMLQNARQEVSRAALKGADLRARKREASRIAGRLVKDPQTLLAQ